MSVHSRTLRRVPQIHHRISAHQMRKLRAPPRGRRGLSEIVGALMLVLIVVSAATVFAVFVASYQKQLQAEEAIQQDRNLEDIRVLSVASTLNWTAVNVFADPTTLLNLNFSIASLGINPSTITGVSVDNQAVANYTVLQLNLTTNQKQYDTVAAGGIFTIYPRDDFALILDVSQGSTSNSFYDQDFGVFATSYVTISLFTSYGNDFTATFLPPTALAEVDQISVYCGGCTPPSYQDEPVLDGTQSFQGGNGTLVSWAWSVSYASGCASTPNPALYAGEKAIPTLSCATTYTIVLTVQNSYGLVGTSTTTYLNG